MLRNAQIMHPDADVPFCHRIEKSVSPDAGILFIHQDGVEVVGVPGFRVRIGGEDNGKACKRFIITLPYFAAPLPISFDSLELMDTDRRLEVHHVVLESAFDDAVMLVSLIAEALPCILAHPMKRQDLDAGRILLFAGEDHPSLSGDDVLRDIKAEAPEIAEGAGFFPPVFRFDGMGAVFDQFQSVPFRQVAQRVHFTRTPRKMNRKDCAGSRSDRGIHSRRIDVQRP